MWSFIKESDHTLKQCIIICSFVFPAGNESCPQPQTSEHLAAIEIMKLKHILILQNKIDLVKESQAKEQYEQILAFVQGRFLEQNQPLPSSLLQANTYHKFWVQQVTMF